MQFWVCQPGLSEEDPKINCSSVLTGLRSCTKNKQDTGPSRRPCLESPTQTWGLRQLAVCSKSQQTARSLGAEMVSVPGVMPGVFGHLVGCHCTVTSQPVLSCQSWEGAQSWSKDRSLARAAPSAVTPGAEAVLCVVGLEKSSSFKGAEQCRSKQPGCRYAGEGATPRRAELRAGPRLLLVPLGVCCVCVCARRCLTSPCVPAVYVVEERRRDDTGESACLTACWTALCCCCLWDMLT